MTILTRLLEAYILCYFKKFPAFFSASELQAAEEQSCLQVKFLTQLLFTLYCFWICVIYPHCSAEPQIQDMNTAQKIEIGHNSQSYYFS